ncbi:HMP/thiamine ABC transporter substrate-binding protein ThiU [Selenomonas sp. TAMA-11512]|uniref:YkoF family thiamine/hydroxymethylpyrimidine-binding protein n=1 Tax=Selenomonas sp. TAMA-11512 TaxID=3095337 RepID=UPI003093D291|nr:HMP/thiamine ABC transporter substrate-binding protein ThiU [Selenomonas sp. TAMA-11512]
MMQHVSYGGCRVGVSGAHLKITGARFSLTPMSDDFINIILGAIKKVDLSNVWAKTDHTSTVYRGGSAEVFDALKACFLFSYRPGIHSALEATISKGCPGDVDDDTVLSFEGMRVNESAGQAVQFPVIGKFSVYPMGSGEYMHLIETLVNRGIDRGIVSGTGHYVTFLGGDVHDVFSYLEEVFHILDEEVSHFVIQVTLLCNVPEGEADE